MQAIFLPLNSDNYYLTIRDKNGLLIHYENIDEQTVNLHETVTTILDSKIKITDIDFSKNSITVNFNLQQEYSF